MPTACITMNIAVAIVARSHRRAQRPADHDLARGAVGKAQAFMNAQYLRPPEEGADTLTWLTTAPEAGQQTGLYYHQRAGRPDLGAGGGRWRGAPSVGREREIAGESGLLIAGGWPWAMDQWTNGPMTIP